PSQPRRRRVHRRGPRSRRRPRRPGTDRLRNRAPGPSRQVTTQSKGWQKGMTVTTVSVKIKRIGSNDRLYLHNGTRGPATTVFQAIYHGCIDGTVIGNWSPAHVDATT